MYGSYAYLPKSDESHIGAFTALAALSGSSADDAFVMVFGEGFCGLEAVRLAGRRVIARVECSARVDTGTAPEAWEEVLPEGGPAAPLVYPTGVGACSDGCKACASFATPKPPPLPHPLPSPDGVGARRMRAFWEVEIHDTDNTMAVVGPGALDPHLMFAPRVTFYVKRPSRAVPPCLVIQPLLMVPRCPGSDVRFVVWADDKDLAVAVRSRCGEARVSEALW